MTTEVRTCFDLGRRLPLTAAVVALDEFCFRRLVTLADLRAFANERRRWPGSVAIGSVLDLVEPKSESPMESRLRLVIVGGGLPRPVAQYEIRINGKLIARVDLAYEEWKIAIEYDGDHHRDRVTFAADLRRQNAIHAQGWTVLRFSAADVLRNPDKVVSTIKAVIRRVER